MPRGTSKHTVESVNLVDSLRASPIHNIQPQAFAEVLVELIDADPTNPGADQFSQRYQRRGPSISESWDIIGRNIYPVIIAARADAPERYVLVDGHGRF